MQTLWHGLVIRDRAYIGREGKFGVDTGRGLLERRRYEDNIKTDSIRRLNQQINIDI
jgi:hypothetical protein